MPELPKNSRVSVCPWKACYQRRTSRDNGNVAAEVWYVLGLEGSEYFRGHGDIQKNKGDRTAQLDGLKNARTSQSETAR